MTIPLIDTHQHLILADDYQYSWAKGLSPLEGKTFNEQDYRDASEGTDITKTIFMESSPDGDAWKAETQRMLEKAEDPDSLICAVVSNGRPEEKGFEAHLDQIQHAKLCGMRRILHVEDDALSQSQGFRDNVSLLATRDLTFDLCVLQRQLPLAYACAKACEHTTMILDHCGVPDLSGDVEKWKIEIKKISELPNVHCKISGIIAYGDAQPETLAPYVEFVIECFGWDRVVWGGDWPVCLLTSYLRDWVSLSRNLVKNCSQSEQEKLFFRNAMNIYKLGPVIDE